MHYGKTDKILQCRRLYMYPDAKWCGYQLNILQSQPTIILILFLRDRTLSDNNYKEMCKYNNKTKKLTSIQDISRLYQYVMESKCRVIVHVNMVDDGKVIQLPLLPASISDYATVIKNINYCFPWAQQRRIQADIAYFESQTGLSTPGFIITFIKSSLITQLPQKPSCPDMFSYQLHHSQKSIINTPFTLCTFVLHQNIEYNLQNRQQILHTLHNNKKYFKTKSQEYRKNRSYAQTEDDRQQAETMAIVKLGKLVEQNKKQIMDNNYGWKINQDTYCFYIQPENTNFINFIHK